MKVDTSQHQHPVIRAAASCRPKEPAALGLLPLALAALCIVMLLFLNMALRHQKYVLVKFSGGKSGVRSGL